MNILTITTMGTAPINPAENKERNVATRLAGRRPVPGGVRERAAFEDRYQLLEQRPRRGSAPVGG
jgi:hypothetical protein